MKRILIFFTILLVVGSSVAQGPGTFSSLTAKQIRANQYLFVPVYSDTPTVTTAYKTKYIGAIIQRRAVGDTSYYGWIGYRWMRIGSGGTYSAGNGIEITGGSQIKLGGTLFNNTLLNAKNLYDLNIDSIVNFDIRATNFTIRNVNSIPFQITPTQTFIGVAGLVLGGRMSFTSLQIEFRSGFNEAYMRYDSSSFYKRISYNSNLGSSFTKHSLIDKNYVDSLYALSSGSGANFANGNLNFTGNRYHNAKGYDLTIDSLDNIYFQTNSGAFLDFNEEAGEIRLASTVLTNSKINFYTGYTGGVYNYTKRFITTDYLTALVIHNFSKDSITFPQIKNNANKDSLLRMTASGKMEQVAVAQTELTGLANKDLLWYNSTTGAFNNITVATLKTEIGNSSSSNNGLLSSTNHIRLFNLQSATRGTGTVTHDCNVGGQDRWLLSATGARTLSYTNLNSGYQNIFYFDNTSGSTIALTLPSNSYVQNSSGIYVSTASVTIPTGKSTMSLVFYDGTDYWFTTSF